MNSLDTIRDEFNLSLENFAEEIVLLLHALEDVSKRLSELFETRTLHNHTVEVTVRGGVAASTFESAVQLARQTPGTRTVIVYVPRNQFNDNLGMIASSGFHVGGSRVEDGVCYMLLRRYV
jgi:tRNA A37 threonylcarbamoyltransferase TsaD